MEVFDSLLEFTSARGFADVRQVVQSKVVEKSSLRSESKEEQKKIITSVLSSQHSFGKLDSIFTQFILLDITRFGILDFFLEVDGWINIKEDIAMNPLQHLPINFLAGEPLI